MFWGSTQIKKAVYWTKTDFEVHTEVKNRKRHKITTIRNRIDTLKTVKHNTIFNNSTSETLLACTTNILNVYIYEHFVL